MPPNSHVVKAPFDEKHPDTIALHCSDGRYTNAIHSLIKSYDRSRYDVMSLPGGAALLDMSSATMIEVEAARAATTFLIQGHKSANAFLVAHAGCGFYRRRYAGQTIERIKERQVRDLQAASGWLMRVHPKVNVYAFMAHPDVEGGRVVFDPVDISDVSKYMVF